MSLSSRIRRWRLRRSPKFVALTSFRNEIRYLPGYVENLEPHVDGIIALDDGSTDGSGEFMASQAATLRLIRRRPRVDQEWNQASFVRAVVEASWRYHPCWCLALDADERVERDFRARAEEEFERAEAEGIMAFALTLREIWDRFDQYRVDGVWGEKRIARLFRTRPDHEFDERKMHTQWAPLNSSRAGLFPNADLIIYHLGMLSRDDRLARHEKWTRLDPDKNAQAIGYDYFLDDEGLQLESLPPGREYLPIPG